MSHILISGLVNTETTVRIREFPIPYYPIDYPFFGIGTDVSGVAYNLAKALRTLGDRVTLLSMTGDDLPGHTVRIPCEHLFRNHRPDPSRRKSERSEHHFEHGASFRSVQFPGSVQRSHDMHQQKR